MTREELEEKIEDFKRATKIHKDYVIACESEIADLQAQLEKCGKRWRAEKNKRYLYISDFGDITDDFDDRAVEDDYRYNTGNYFCPQAESEAEAYKQALEKIQEYECEVCIEAYKTCNPPFSVEIAYDFETESEAEDFAQDLKLVLRKKESDNDDTSI
jgi:hypothetical protein